MIHRSCDGSSVHFIFYTLHSAESAPLLSHMLKYSVVCLIQLCPLMSCVLESSKMFWTYQKLILKLSSFCHLSQGVGVLWRRLPENIIFHTQRIICGITFTSFLSGFPTFWSFDLFVVWIEFCLLYFYNPFFRILCCLQNKCYLVWCR